MVKKERWVLLLQVDNMYTRGWAGELRGGRQGVREKTERERGGEREGGAEGVLQVLW